MDLGLSGKVALVTGGSTGLGYAIARELFREGADVILASRSLEKLERARESLLKIRPAGKITCQSVDLGSEESIRSMMEKIPHQRVDILVNNVGGPAAGDPVDITLKQWDSGYFNLLRSVIVLTQLVVPSMKEKKWGRILNVTSSSAKEIIPKLPVSSTFRSGLTGFTKEFAKSLGRSGIIVNNLLPGPVDTDRLKELEVKSPEFYKSMERNSALGRVGRPEEIGRIAAFLCSEANGYITGTNVLADGGFTSAL